MNKRLEMLQKLTAAGSADSFAWYALALEYRKEKRFEQALATFEVLRSRDPDYVPMYLMAAQTLSEAGRPSEAVPWLEQGIEKARARGDVKALSELQHAYSEVG